MRPKPKTFDCVAMKNRIQAEVEADRKRLGEAEIARRHREWIETSDTPLARWWRTAKGVAI